MRYIISTLIVLAATIFIFGYQTNAKTIDSGELIKASGPAVYYYYDGKRYVFPNEDVYFSWYENFDEVNMVTDETLASVQIGGNVTYKPASRLVKIVSDPKVYMVTEGNKLQWVQSEADAIAIYGNNWADEVRDVSDALFLDYTIGEPLEEADYVVKDFLSNIQLSFPHYASLKQYLRSVEISGDIDDYLHPDIMSGLEVDGYGYVASSTYSMAELYDFYTTNSQDWTLQTDYLHGYPSGTARLLNYSKSLDNGFAHRSVIITDAPVSSYREVVFHEINYPAGYLSYPGGVTFEYLAGEQDVNHAFIATVSEDEIKNWYKAIGATAGWKATELEDDDMDQFTYYRMEHEGLQRSLQHVYLDNSIMPEFAGLQIIGSEFNKIIE